MTDSDESEPFQEKRLSISMIKIMQDDYSHFEKRKKAHIELALLPQNQASENNQLDQIHLCHEALPDLNFNEIDLFGERLGKKAKPFLVSSMTAGHQSSLRFNDALMGACAKSGWAMGVGSQRRELSDQFAQQEWSKLRQRFPKVEVFSNLGISQLIHTPFEKVQNLVNSLQAKALMIHCNPLQEAIQPEGTPFFKGSWQALERLIKAISVPVIIKETGCGFSFKTLKRLDSIGVSAVELSGLGGTHWGRIEGERAAADSPQAKGAQTFKHWGIDTLQSMKNALACKVQYEIWGSGGLRHGLDAARLFALGASTVGFAKPLVQAALEGSEAVLKIMETIEYELKVAMFCTGSHCLNDLRDSLCL